MVTGSPEEVGSERPRRGSSSPRRRSGKGKSRAERDVAVHESRQRLEWRELLEVVAAYASSRPGKEAVLSLEPSADRDEIRSSLLETDEVRTLLEERYAFRLGELPPLDAVFSKGGALDSRVLSGEELRGVYKLLDRARSLGSMFRDRADLPTLCERGQAMRDLTPLRERLELSIGSKGEVLSSASVELSAIRDECRREEDDLRRWMERRRQSSALKKALQGDVISVRNNRFVFAVRAEYRGRVRGIVHGESGSGATIFIEPEEIVLRGNHLSELRERERREVARILIDLTREVREARVYLEALFSHLVAVDVALGRARFGEAFGCRSAEVSEDRYLKLVAARHPLLLWRDRDQDLGLHELGLEALHEEIVPLDVEVGRGSHQIVVTGPNTGGKTVVLKTVGLLSLMTYAGIPVPAGEGTCFPLFDAVLADIGDEQSLQQNLSTFSAHMTGIARILRVASSRSLVLLDELGAGTDPLEGAALGEAILERLYVRGTFTLVTTHLGSLKEFAFRHRKCQNACMEFDSGKLAPTFRLLVGLPGRSNALIIARRIGLPDEAVNLAEQLLLGEERVGEEVLEGLERTRQDLERKRSSMEKERREAKRLKESAAEEVESLRSMGAAIDHEAERSEEERVQRLADRMEAALKQLGDPPRDRRDAYDHLREIVADARQRTRLAERRLETAQALRKGDMVFVPRFRSVAEIRKINKGKQALTVMVNGVPTEVSFLDISWVLPPPGYEAEWYED